MLLHLYGKDDQNKNYLKHHKCNPGAPRKRTDKNKEKQTFTCHVCGNIYQNNESLKNHINIIHMGQRNFPCDICGKLFTRARTMKTHRKNIHNDIKQFNCIYCNSAYGEKRNLLNHIKRNHPGSELMYRRITPQGEAIMDDKTSLSQVSLSHIKEGLPVGFEDKDSAWERKIYIFYMNIKTMGTELYEQIKLVV